MELEDGTLQLVEEFLPHTGCLPESVQAMFIEMCLTGEAASHLDCACARSLIRKANEMNYPLPNAAIALLYVIAPVAHRSHLGRDYSREEFRIFMQKHNEH